MTTNVRIQGVPDVAKGALSSWRDGPAKKEILAFVAAACGHDGSEPVPPEYRVAVFDNDGTLWCEKPVPIQMDFILRRFVEMIRIWSRTGRRPLLAAGNSNGDIPMLDFTRHEDKPFLRLLVLHDDAEHEFDYTAGAEQALDQAGPAGWTTISVRDDWATVF